MKGFRNWVFGYGIILSLTLLTVHWSNRAITVFTENAAPARSRTIIIDPGHGGVDGGATSCTGVLESQLNLEISLRLGDLLRFMGHNVSLIRTGDFSVYREGDTIAGQKISDLKERVRMVNKTENALLLSIHQNQFADGKYSGAQVFYAGTAGSQALAKELQADFVRYLNPGSRRQEKKSSGIYLMEHIRCPGVLIECGFLSNPEEEAKLRSVSYQQKLCAVIGCRVSEFLANT